MFWPPTTAPLPRPSPAARKSGKPFDFAAMTGMTATTGLPLLADATAALNARLSAFDAGTHRIFFGRVVHARRGEADPLVYCNRDFRRIAAY